MKDEDIKGLPITWVNTPLSYAKLTTKYNLFQQAVLLKVSEALQRQMELYYGSELKNNPDVPRPLFTEEQKRAGLPKIYVSYAELGVSASSFPKVRAEAEQCLKDMVVAGPVILKNGKPTQSLYPVFTEVHVDHSNSTCSFELNTALIDPDNRKDSVIDYTFDMSQRYVKHPDNIAIVGKVEKMPGLYFLLRDTMQSWKYKKARLTVTQIKEFLNMYKVNDDGVREPRYPKYSQFKNHVLTPALADIQRLKEIGQIDVSFTMREMYKGTRKVGDPECIIFAIDDGKQAKSEQTTINFEQPTNGTKEWQTFLGAYDGPYKDMLKDFVFKGFEKGVITLGASSLLKNVFEKSVEEGGVAEQNRMVAELQKAFGCQVGVRYEDI